jgi:PAS domain S-box-containing protein
MSPDLLISLVFNNIEVPCMLTIPVAFLLIVLYHTGNERYVTIRTLPLFFLGVIVLSFLEFTNPLHYLYYTGFAPVAWEGLVFWIHKHGPFFWLTIAYTYALVLLAIFLLVSHLSVTGPCHRRSLSILLVAAVVPVIFNILCTFWITPLTGIDLTQMSFLIPGLILAFGLFRYLFSPVPVAYTQILATMQDGVIITDGTSRIIDLNPAARQMTGLHLRESVGKDIGSLVPALAPCRTGDCQPREGCRSECRIPQADGQPRYLDVISLPLGNEGAAPEGDLFVLRDITERKHAELALSEANKKINLLSGITRHDIRNQLMALKAYIQLSEECVNDPAELTGYIEKLNRIADAIERQIEFTRDYENMGATPPAWQDVGTCIESGREGLFLTGIRVEADVAAMEIFADPLLVKVFYNLFDNALRYGGSSIDTLRITTHIDDVSLVLVVEDNGQGVPAEDRPRLFTKGFGKNTGLGLFLSREILSLTGITITETGRPGGGARFEIRVPPGKFRYREKP